MANLNIIVGTVQALQQTVLTPQETAIFENDYAILVYDLKKLVDPDLGADLQDQHDFYAAVAQVAKGYFTAKAFGGLKAQSGQFGMRLVIPQDLKAASSAITPQFYSWYQTLTTGSGKTIISPAAISNSGGNVYASGVLTQQACLGFHRLISYQPNPRLLAIALNVNGVQYIPYAVEPYSQISKGPNKLFRILPLPGNVLIQPTGGFYADFYMDLQGGQSTPSGTTSFNVQVGLFGLAFGEFVYLQKTAIT